LMAHAAAAPNKSVDAWMIEVRSATTSGSSAANSAWCPPEGGDLKDTPARAAPRTPTFPGRNSLVRAIQAWPSRISAILRILLSRWVAVAHLKLLEICSRAIRESREGGVSGTVTLMSLGLSNVLGLNRNAFETYLRRIGT